MFAHFGFLFGHIGKKSHNLSQFVPLWDLYCLAEGSKLLEEGTYSVCVFLVKGSVLAANCVQGGAAVCPVGLHHQWVECDYSIKLLSSVFVMSANVRCLIGSWFAFPFHSRDLF